MTEKELVAKIQQLRRISPNQNWVVSTKTRILGKEEPETILTSFWTAFLRKPVFAVSAAILVLIGGVVFYLDLAQKPSAEIAETPLFGPEQAEIILALEKLQIEVSQATEAIKKIKEPQKALEAGNIVSPIIDRGKSITAEAKKLKQDFDYLQKGQILAVKIENVENAFSQLEQKHNEMIKQEAAGLIEYLSGKTLTETQRELLEMAKNDYLDGNYHLALVNSLFVTQIQQ